MDSFVYCLLLFMPDIKETKNTFFFKMYFIQSKIIKQVKKVKLLFHISAC